MNVAIMIATCGDPKWSKLAEERAFPSAHVEWERWEQQRQPGAVAGVGHIHSPDLTLAQARNFMAETCLTGSDWLCFLDADDELEPGYLDAMEAALQRPVPQRLSLPRPLPPLLVPAVRRVTGDVVTGRPATIPNRGRWPQVNECVIGTLVHRGLFERVGGFRDHTDDGTVIAMYEDWDLWLRCWDAGAKLVYVPGAVYREHVSRGRNTNAHLSQSVYEAIWADHLARP